MWLLDFLIYCKTGMGGWNFAHFEMCTVLMAIKQVKWQFMYFLYFFFCLSFLLFIFFFLGEETTACMHMLLCSL